MTIALDGSFGYNPAELAVSREEAIRRSETARHTKVALVAIGSVIGWSAIAATAILCPVAVPLAVAGVWVGASIIGYSVDKLHRYRNICKAAGVVFSSAEFIRYAVSGKGASCRLLPTRDGKETEQWRERLIASAEHNIVLSGNYCGGDSFNRLLSKIEERMKERPELKVIIISSPKFIKKAHREKLNELRKLYPDRFSLVESPDIWHVSPGLKKVTNHTKVCVVDYGRRFMQGGSGIQDSFAASGLDEPEEEEIKGVGGFLGQILPRTFRDQDFVGESAIEEASSTGRQTYIQALLLAHRWEEYQARLKHTIGSPVKASELGLITGIATPISDTDSLAVRLLRTPVPQDLDLPSIPEFDRDERTAFVEDMEIIAQGPHQTSSAFAARLIEQINKAEHAIHINHMYFHPSSAVFDALVAAANRGVKITVITNGVHKDAPKAHNFFAPRNRYNYIALRNAIQPDKRQNLEVYEFEQDRKGTHKKVVVVDDTVIAGSSNLGHKSLTLVCDDELNFVAKSRDFAQGVLAVFAEDIRHSRRIEDYTSGIRLIQKAAGQRLLAPLID